MSKEPVCHDQTGLVWQRQTDLVYHGQTWRSWIMSNRSCLPWSNLQRLDNVKQILSTMVKPGEVRWCQTDLVCHGQTWRGWDNVKWLCLPWSDLERLDNVKRSSPRWHNLSCHNPCCWRLQVVRSSISAGVNQKVHGSFKSDLLKWRRVGGNGHAVETFVESLAGHVVGQQGQVSVVDRDLVGIKHTLHFLWVKGHQLTIMTHC